jgi:hypothetical protein
MPIFLHILPELLYTVIIAQAASLCLFQKFVVARPAVFAQKVLTSSSVLNTAQNGN